MSLKRELGKKAGVKICVGTQLLLSCADWECHHSQWTKILLQQNRAVPWSFKDWDCNSACNKALKCVLICKAINTSHSVSMARTLKCYLNYIAPNTWHWDYDFTLEWRKLERAFLLQYHQQKEWFTKSPFLEPITESDCQNQRKDKHFQERYNVSIGREWEDDEATTQQSKQEIQLKCLHTAKRSSVGQHESIEPLADVDIRWNSYLSKKSIISGKF